MQSVIDTNHISEHKYRHIQLAFDERCVIDSYSVDVLISTKGPD